LTLRWKTSSGDKPISMPIPVLPKVSDSPEVHADWLEWRALKSIGKYVSWSDHQRALRIEGSDESLVEAEEDGLFEPLINDIAAELSERQTACGAGAGYPFEITPNGLVAHWENESTLVYKFLLLLTMEGRLAGPPGSYGDRLFEDLCAEAFAGYLGKPLPGADVNVFGFPRRVGVKDFSGAVDQLCRALGEGGGAKMTPRTLDQKDGHLDLVAWRAFPDSKVGKLIAFGQCATGEHWFDKLHELRPSAWNKLWLREPLSIDPIACFFLPRRVERELWPEATFHGGIVFDRCRITWLVQQLPAVLLKSLLSWTEHALGFGPTS
jgi:hypothetical protein